MRDASHEVIRAMAQLFPILGDAWMIGCSVKGKTIEQ
jgi:hypothetical protein